MPRAQRDLNLKERQGVVQSLWTAVNEGGAWLKDVPRIVRTVIETGAWAEREVDGRVVTHKRFVDFITANPRAGCGWQPEKVEALISHDAETLRLWEEATKLGQGTRTDLVDNVHEVEGRSTGNSRARTLSLLKNKAPEFYERVCAGEMSANAAAIEAGLRKKPKPFDTIVRLLDQLTFEERARLREML